MSWDILKAVAPLAGSVLGFMGSEEQNQANNAQSQAQMDFQERMSNTSYQRAVADMKAAGLNPMLAYSQGGASSPGGSQAVMQNSSAAAAAAGQATAALDLTKAQTEKTHAETDKVRAETQIAPETIAELRQRVLTGQATAAQVAELARRAKAENDTGEGIGRYTAQRTAGEAWDVQEKYRLNYRINEAKQMAAELRQTDAHTRRAIASAILDELDAPRGRGEAGYWTDVGKGGVYAREGAGLAGRIASSAASVGFRLPRQFNELLIPRQGGGYSRSGQR